MYFLRRIVLFLPVLFFFHGPILFGAEPSAPFPAPLESYADASTTDLGAKLLGRIRADPFNLVATLIFFAAIVHTFLAAKFRAIGHGFEHELRDLSPDEQNGKVKDRKKFLAVLFHFLGEVEVVFGIWVIPLAIATVLMKGMGTMENYINSRNFTEPLFVVAIMAIASSRPVLHFAESCLGKVAGFGRGTVAAWWLSILTVGPLLGSVVTEPAAMTICALLLLERFFKLHPSMPLRYATLGLLFVNISVGGTLTHFAAPPVVMVAAKWDWGLMHMMTEFGWKAAVGIVVSNLAVFLIFQKELLGLGSGVTREASTQSRASAGLILIHLLFIGAVVYFAHYAAIVVFILMIFIAFIIATEHNQDTLNLRSPVLVGFFLAGLVIHGGCQAWWIEPVLTSMNPVQLLIASTGLTAFNDNAAITYLASLVPNFSAEAKYAVVAGAVAGGGLTVIANAPNPAGQSILQNSFGKDGVNALSLLLAAIGPTIVMILVFLFFP